MKEKKITIVDLLKSQVGSHPEKLAIIEESKEMTYKELWDSVCRLGSALKVKGVQKDDRVFVILPNSIEFIQLFFALGKIGAVMVPLQPIFTIREYKEMFDKIQPRHIITTVYILTKVLAYEDNLIQKYRFIINENEEWVKTKYENIISIEDLYLETKGLSSYDEEIDDNPIASINFTYRGLGYPLGAVITHENYICCMQKLSTMTSFVGKRYLSALPMAHIFSLVCYVLVPILNGLTTVIIKSHAAWEFLKAIEKYKVDIIFGVPTFYTYILKSWDREKFDISHLRCGFSGGSFLSKYLHNEIENGLGIKVFQGYGLTEGLIVSANTKEKEKVETLGPPFEGMEIKILDQDGRTLDRGEKGEIYIKSSTVMEGYYKDVEATDIALKEGWLSTGDYGKLDEEGYLYFEGLKKRIAKVGGHIVDFKEVEKVLFMHPHVQSVRVYSEHNAFWGETVIAELETGIKTSEEEILNFCSTRLAVYKIPKKIKIINREGSHVLVLDDDIEYQCNYLFDLNQEGYNVNSVDAAFKAIEEIKNGFYNLMITEIVLPDKEGEELLSKITAINENLPIIIVTSHPDVLESVDLHKYNVITAMTKPVLKEDLLKIINNIKRV